MITEDIKLVLENQLAIMRWIAESGIGREANLTQQIQKTKERINQLPTDSD